MLNLAAVQLGNILAFSLGYPEIIIIVVALLLLFGGKKLPELARGLGRGLRLFRREVKGIQDDVEGSDEGEERKDSQQALPPREDSEKDTDERAG
jgi:sec-independent protein translocase protein TatA